MNSIDPTNKRGVLFFVSPFQVEDDNQVTGTLNEKVGGNHGKRPKPQPLYWSDKKIDRTKPQKEQTPKPTEYCAHKLPVPRV